jgi:hypothetical protein
MGDVQMLERAASPPAEFSLQAYADQSFGIYQEAPEDVVLRSAARRRATRCAGAST